MDIILVSFNAVAPLFLFMALGYFLRREEFISEKTAFDMNMLVFKIFLPVNIVLCIYKEDLSKSVDMKVLVYGILCIVIPFFIAWFVADKKEKDNTCKPVAIQGILKSNYNLLGLPVIESIYGLSIGMAAFMVPVVTIVNNVLCVFIFEHYRGDSHNPLKMLIKTVKNPLVLGSVIGLLLNLTHCPIPDFINSGFLKGLSSCATPVGLIALGAMFKFDNLKKYAKTLLSVSVSRLIIMPAVLVTVAALIGIRGTGLAAIAIITGGPTAVNSYSTAVAMGGNSDLANGIVVITSLFSVLTLFGVFCIIGTTVGF